MKNKILFLYYKALSVWELFIVGFNKLVSLFIPPPKVFSTDETLKELIENKYSISRFGDGEFSLIFGKDLLFQPYSVELSSRLEEVLNSCSDNHKILIPNVFKDLSWCTENSRRYWNGYLNLNRSKIYKLIDRKRTYYDSLVSRLYMDHENKTKAEERFKSLQKLWEDRDIVIVEGEQSRLGFGNNLFQNVKSINRIICPAINAYAKYDEILLKVKECDKSALILIALGPTATVLSYDLALMGFHAVDIGHVDIEYEWFLQRSSVKIPINNKFIGEIVNGTHVNDEIEGNYKRKYEEEIIIRITG